MKIYIISDWPYHDNCTIYGAYSSELLARAAMANYKEDGSGWIPTRIVAVELDAPADGAEAVIESGG